MKLNHFLLLLICCFCSLAYAQSPQGGKQAKAISRLYGKNGLLLDFGIYYGQTEATANPAALNEWQSTTSVYDVKFGYVDQNNFYWGAEYSVRNDNQILASNTAGSGAGLGFGYFAENGFNIRGFYRFNDRFGDYSNGSGYQADLGYSINLTSNFFLGFLVSIRQISYKDNPTIAAFDTWTRKETYPFITLGFLFN